MERIRIRDAKRWCRQVRLIRFSRIVTAIDYSRLSKCNCHLQMRMINVRHYGIREYAMRFTNRANVELGRLKFDHRAERS